MFSLAEHRRHLSTVNVALAEIAGQEPGSRRREELERLRSEACRCVGAGGLGRIIAVLDGVPLMERACGDCMEGALYAETMAGLNARLDEQEREEEEARRNQEREAKVADRLDRSGVPDDYRDSTFKVIAGLPCSMSKTFRAALVLLHGRFEKPWPKDRTPKGVYLYGPAGHGKTSMFAAIVRRCAEIDTPVMFTTVLNLLDSMRAGYSRNDGSSDTLLERAKKVQVLLLDDLGMQLGTEHERARLLAIILERHGNRSKRMTCFSSNYDVHRTARMIAGGKNALQEEVARIEGRLTEMADPILIENLDLRIKANRRTT
jgi:DNA replication protein DnaC